jgi:choloylglycine hydrolase
MCTRVFNFYEGSYAVTGKNTDWFYPMDARVYINPVGIKKQGMSQELAKFLQVPKDDILSWRAKYQSIAYYIYGELPKVEGYQETEFCSMDGMNSEGLAVNVLADAQSTFKDVKEPSANKIATIRFSQYLLDRFATVKKAVKHIKKNELFLFDPGVPNKSDRQAWFHFTLSDPSGDSAVIEFKKGNVEIYHDKSYIVTTNQPSYNVQLDLMKYWEYQWTPQDDTPEQEEKILTTVPGGSSSVQRFERAAYYTHFVQPAQNTQLAVAQTKGIMSTVSTPMQFSKYGKDQERYTHTIWTTLSDQMNKRYYFQPAYTMNSMYIDMPTENLKVSKYAQVAQEKDNHYDLNESSGDIAEQLTNENKTPFMT